MSKIYKQKQNQTEKSKMFHRKHPFINKKVNKKATKKVGGCSETV